MDAPRGGGGAPRDPVRRCVPIPAARPVANSYYVAAARTGLARMRTSPVLSPLMISVALVSNTDAFQLREFSTGSVRLPHHATDCRCRHPIINEYSTALAEGEHAPTESPQLIAADESPTPSLLTSAVLNVSYDGGHFHGWSASNGGAAADTKAEDALEYSSRPNGASFLPPIHGQRQNQPHMAGRKRRRGKRIPGLGTTHVRSVEGVIATALAKVYGDVDIKQIQIEGCSRTDKGVHGQSMVALFYCLTEEAARKVAEERQRQEGEADQQQQEKGVAIETETETVAGSRTNSNGIPGKRIPHPVSPTDDSSFQRLPFNGNVDKLMFVLNRMLPPDVRISNIAPTPAKSSDELPFHPTLDAREKTYRYTLSMGHVHDPMRWRHVWHVDTYGKGFDIEMASQCAALFVGRHDFAAFRGAFRGSERKRVQSDTVCNLSRCSMEQEVEDVVDCLGDSPLADVFVGGNSDEATENGLEPLSTYTVTVTGNRFLYKQVRFMVGSIVSVGLGNISLGYVRSALESGRREEEEGSAVGKGKQKILCAPSHGLCLTDVQFGHGIEFEWRV